MAYQFAIPLATSVLSSAYDWFTGESQEDRVRQLEQNNVRPDFDIPGSATRALESAENQASLTRLPGQSAIEGRLDANTANQIGMVERLGIGGPTAINAAARAYGNQQDAETTLGIQAAQTTLNNQDIFRRQLGNMAEWENKKWNWEKGEPYLQKQAAIAALKEASLRNKNTAFKNLLGGLGNTALGGFDWFGGGGDTGGASVQDALYKSGTNVGNPEVVTTDKEVIQPYPEMKTYTDKLMNQWNWTN